MTINLQNHLDPTIIPTDSNKDDPTSPKNPTMTTPSTLPPHSTQVPSSVLSTDNGVLSNLPSVRFFNDSFNKNNNFLTHGYVHGHIHKHKDHTHIHGHIHNHDHDHHYKQRQEQQQEEQQEQQQPELSAFTTSDVSCPEFENIALCKDVLCDELDDCFFLNCDDSKLDFSCCDVNPSFDEVCCNDANCQEEEKLCENLQYDDSNVICEDPKCKKSDDCCINEVSNHLDKNNLCELQLSKKPIFENLINNVHQNLHSQKQVAGVEEPPTKKSKFTNEIDLHFPHHCHPDDDNNSANHHHFHQSCFHTTISDKNQQQNLPETLEFSELMNDFDFVIHFNQILNKATDVEQTSSSTNLEVLEEGRSKDSIPYYCQWEKCFRKVNNETLLSHVKNSHIDQEYQPKSSSLYQCEWDDCNFINDNYSTLLEHLNSHKLKNLTLPSQHQPSSVLTPLSTTSMQSNLSSPSTLSANDLNITSMKIMPKKTKIHVEDTEFRCHWEVGVDSLTGQPIPCNKTHNSSGDLQRHMIEDHIGSGKSIYNCCWIGCDRHNGKFFTQRQKLFRHIHVHTNHKPCKCEICGSCFAVESMLQQHLRTHSGEKPFKCTECGKSFATSSSLSIHKRVHTGEKPSVCKYPGCGKRFSESSNLIKHERIHSKNFKCEYCDEIFEKKRDLTRHLKNHNQNEGKSNDKKNNQTFDAISYNLLRV